MNVRSIERDELATLVDDLWFPFAEEMVTIDEYNEIAPDVREEAVDYREEQFAAEDVATFVADRAGRLVGYAVVQRSPAPPVFARGASAHLEELYVRPDDRGEGIGTALIARVETWGRERDCEFASLAVNVENHVARDLYDSEGFRPRRVKMDKRL